MIINVYDNRRVDHINHNVKDNRKSNLRIVTISQNAINKKIVSNNTSGVTGICWNKNSCCWQAYITLNYKTKHLGCFKNKEDAIKARKDAEEKYFGEYSYKNSMKVGEVIG